MNNVYLPESAAKNHDGDDEQLNAAFAHYRALNYFGLLFTRDVNGTRELVQAAYTAWWKNRHQYPTPQAIRDALFSLMIELSFDWMLSSRTPIRLPDNPAMAGRQPPKDQTLLVAHAKADFIFSSIHVFLLDQPLMAQNILTGFLLDGKRPAAIAEQLILPIAAVMHLLETEIPRLKQIILTGAKTIGS